MHGRCTYIDGSVLLSDSARRIVASMANQTSTLSLQIVQQQPERCKGPRVVVRLRWRRSCHPCPRDCVKRVFCSPLVAITLPMGGLLMIVDVRHGRNVRRARILHSCCGVCHSSMAWILQLHLAMLQGDASRKPWGNQCRGVMARRRRRLQRHRRN